MTKAFYVYGTTKRKANIIKITKTRITAEVPNYAGEMKIRKFKVTPWGLDEITENNTIGGRLFIIKENK